MQASLTFFQFFYLLLVHFCAGQENNVCKNVEDYSNNMNVNVNCWHNDEIDSTPEYVANKYGISLNRHYVISDDGYILTLFRLNKNKQHFKGGTVYIQHGMGTNALHFMVNGNMSLAFYLVNHDFDVWLGNARGNPFSLNHRYLNEFDDKYWDFSFHEMGLYDIPVTLRYISKKVKCKNKITYIGHSMGSTAALVYATLKPEHARAYIKKMILLCPPVFMKHTKGLQARYIVKGASPYIGALRSEGLNVMLREGSTERTLISSFCISSSENTKFCMKMLGILFGPTSKILPEHIPLLFSIFKNLPVKAVDHYSQFILSAKFQYFDYGNETNLEIYNTTAVPGYDITKINVSIDLVYDENDYEAPKEDVKYLFENLKISQKTITELKKFNHIDLFLEDNEDQSQTLPVLLKLIRNK